MAVIRSLFGSKKFVTAFAGILSAAAMKLGFDIDTTAVMAVLSPLIAYILGQAVADFGKES